MKKKYFGTDGIRGLVNSYPITSDFFVHLAFYLCENITGSKFKKIIIGKDTRISCDMIESSMISGFLSMGFDCIQLGVVPTPLVSFMTKKNNVDLGIMISASHNPFHDNGIKVFNNNGDKLTDLEELKIEKLIEEKLIPNFCKASLVGKLKKYDSNFIEYKKSISKVIPKNISFKGLKVVLDCANGAAYKIGPEILSDHGVDLVTQNVKPSGKNINHNCGALYPQNLKKVILQNNADLGVAFDGDADRLIICDENGSLINGDKILAIVSSSLSRQGKLKGKGIVATKMSNLGLHAFLEDINLNVYESPVGDRYVIEKMKHKKCNLGGEQSGHIIFSDLSSTGDAILSTLQVLSILKIEGKTLSQLLSGYKETYQKLVNLKLYGDPENIIRNQNFKEKVEILKKSLNKKGSILIRKSGTENLLRVMVQSHERKKTDKIIENIKTFIYEIDKK
ncbi:phosphoglucosamine mutase [Rickettsiales bacterium]|nr:phosphoglucosamine mutase [Rickettsiales bacterium]